MYRHRPEEARINERNVDKPQSLLKFAVIVFERGFKN